MQTVKPAFASLYLPAYSAFAYTLFYYNTYTFDSSSASPFFMTITSYHRILILKNTENLSPVINFIYNKCLRQGDYPCCRLSLNVPFLYNFFKDTPRKPDIGQIKFHNVLQVISYSIFFEFF